MFFILSHIFGVLAIPSNLVVLIGIVGVVLLPTRFFVAGRKLLVVSFLLIVTIGILPIGTALTLPLESRFPPWNAGKGTPTGIVVLGGTINLALSAARGQIALGEAAERVTAAVELARKYPEARIVFSGGIGRIVQGQLREADFARQFFEDLGVAPDRIVLERESRNTEENAIFSKRIVAPKPGERWLLVTSAMHMPRAIGVFRKAGFPVEAYPVDYRSSGWSDLLTIPGSFMDGVARTDNAMHEWVGLFAYWITGRIAVPLPGP